MVYVKKLSKAKILLTVFFLCLVTILFSQLSVSAAFINSIDGFAWGGTPSASGAYQGMGWISTSNIADGSGVAYGLKEVPFTPRWVTGYAWSEHYGWISFNASDLTGCSPTLFQAKIEDEYLVGGARVLSIKNAGSNKGGFDGCINLDAPGAGIIINDSVAPFTLTGYAWSSDFGWIDFTGVEINFEAGATMTVTSCSIAIGNSSCDGTVTWEIEGSASPGLYKEATQLYTTSSGTNQPITLSYGVNTVTARDGSDILETKTPEAYCETNGAYSDSSGTCVDARPNLSNIIVSHSVSASINPVTATYDSVNIIMNTQNTGLTSTTIDPEYTIAIDRDGNGYEETSSPANIGVLASGQSSANLFRSFANVPFGPIRVMVTVDSEDTVEESDETDNVREVDLNILPPDPGLSIVADRSFVRKGETVHLVWQTTLNYPMSCSVKGPNVTVNSSGTSGETDTQPISSKSEFVFTCVEPNSGAIFTDSAIVETVGTVEEI